MPSDDNPFVMLGEGDTEHLFGSDYLAFAPVRDEHSDADLAVIRSLLDLQPGTRLLDVPCGHGRIANRLAELGVEITGLDASPSFLEQARAGADERGVAVDYRHGDMRELPADLRGFDVFLCWFTSFGYFDDAGNRRVLESAFAALRPGGQVLIDVRPRETLLRLMDADGAWTRLVDHGDELRIDRVTCDYVEGCTDTERIYIRDGEIKRITYRLRNPTATELRDWLLATGFEDVEAFDERARRFGPRSQHLVMRARRPGA